VFATREGIERPDCLVNGTGCRTLFEVFGPMVNVWVFVSAYHVVGFEVSGEGTGTVHVSTARLVQGVRCM
jgi:hypothetical protein